MSLIASLPDIDLEARSIYVLHEKLERHIPIHQHNKGQLSYVEGGIAYVHIQNKTLVVPTRHYFWIPPGLPHILKVSHSATVLRSVFFYTFDDDTKPFYGKVGIYPINELLLQMIKHSEQWEGQIRPEDHRYQFLATVKNLLPDISTRFMPMALPTTDNERMMTVLEFIEKQIAEPHTLDSISDRFGFSNRSLSRLFRSTLGISFLQYLKLLRMVKAFEMILGTDMSMTAIAYAVGYQSLSSFSTTFHQFTNFSPSSFNRYKS